MWYNKYIGLPYQDRGRTTAGIDCWGLACLVYREHFDIELPTLDDEYFGSEDLAVKQLVLTTKESWIATKEPKAGDICVFNILGEPTHVGIYVGEGKFLHARAGQDSVIESLNSVAWSRRLEGIYQYNPGKIQLVGAPHPLQTQNIVTDWALAGTSIIELTKYIQEKYKVSTKLLERIVVLVDGMPIPQQQWQTTKLLPGQTVAYRVMAASGGTGRLLMTLAVVIAAITLGPEFGTYLAESEVAGPATAGAIKGWTVAAQIGINLAGMALVSAIAPIRQPKDPGQVVGLNLFNGSSNPINRFGAIPVVLGKVRMTAVHGATPYIESLRDTSVINMALIWGFGPLSISDIHVGVTPIANFYAVDLKGKSDQAAPAIIYGTPGENTTGFDNLYSQDVTQQVVNVELTNNPDTNLMDGATVSPYGPWKEVYLSDQCTRIQLAFNFPIGLRSIKPTTGEIGGAYADIDVQYKKANDVWTDMPPYVNHDTNSTGYWQETLQPPTSVVSVDGGSTIYYYQWYIISLQPGGGIICRPGTPTTSRLGEPSTSFTAIFEENSYSSLLNNNNYLAKYTRLPFVPSDEVQLYQVCLNSDGFDSVVDMRTSISGNVPTGLVFSQTTVDGNIQVQVTTGNIINSGTGYSTITEQLKFSTLDFTSSAYNITQPTDSPLWCQFLKDYGIWISQATLTSPVNASALVVGKTYTIATPGTTDFTLVGAANNTAGTGFVATGAGTGTGTAYLNTLDISQTWTVAESGTYKVYFSADNTAQLYIDGELIMSLDDQISYTSAFTNTVYISAGARVIRIVAVNSNITTDAAVGVKFTITKDGITNANTAALTTLHYGVQGNFYKYKDAFNDTYEIRNLPLDYYSVRVRRRNRVYDNEVDPASGGFYPYHKSVLVSVTGYAPNQPMTNPPGCYLAKTAIRLQSTGKVNGTVDGINAYVQTRAYDVVYNSAGVGSWVANRETNNPASLFRYVLTHPANMYAVSLSEIDLDQLVVWHKFCQQKGFTYNNVIMNTQSVMDTLREICAAGLASPTMINGKWSVVMDAPRSFVTQHFTPHNSWGFESTKALPKIPDAFRVTINNEAKAFQPDEFFVYREGVTGGTAKIYEQLSLPGVTNKAQATYLAKWHFAQLKLRPEIYKLNVDFEYLVCTRGDLVRVSHDIPQWGAASGRVSSISYNSTTGKTTVNLTEQVYLDSTKTYTIRFRTNTNTFYSLPNKTLLANSYTTGYTSTITIGEDLVTLGVASDNLFMLGELVSGTAKDSQELIVLSIEPTSNTSATLTLTDYSSSIYNEGFTNLVYDTGIIAGSNNPIVVNSITDTPTIQKATSDSNLSQEVSPGVYTNVVQISIAHPSNLTEIAQKIEVQYTNSEDDMNTDSMGSSIVVDKAAGGGIAVQGLVAGKGYKFRARYLNNVGTIRGPWSSPPYNVTVTGKTTNNLTSPAITVSLDDHYLVISPTSTAVSQDNAFNTFEYRVYQSTGTGDFWALSTTLNPIKFVQSRSAGRIDLLDFPTPRISQAGITYRVACRVLDTNNNYSSTSTLTSITIATIQ